MNRTWLRSLLIYPLFWVGVSLAGASSNDRILFNTGRFDVLQNMCLNTMWPDGSRQMTSFEDSASGYGIYVVRRDGSDPTRLANDGMSDLPDRYPLSNLRDFRIFTDTVLPAAQPGPTVVQQEPSVLYEFNKPTVEANGWAIIPAGFSGAQPGTISTVNFTAGQIASSDDKVGLAFSVEPGQVAFAHAAVPINTGEKPVVLRVTVQADAPHASVALAVLRGRMGETDWSIATHIPFTAASFVGKERCLALVYEPDAGEAVTPIIQVAATGQTGTVTVLVDKLEAIVLENQNYDGTLFHSTPR